MIPEKFFSGLFVLGRVQGIAGNVDLGLAFITMDPQTIRTTDDQSDNTKYLQVEQEYGGVHPAPGKVLQFRVFRLYWLVYYLIHNDLITVQK